MLNFYQLGLLAVKILFNCPNGAPFETVTKQTNLFYVISLDYPDPPLGAGAVPETSDTELGHILRESVEDFREASEVVTEKLESLLENTLLTGSDVSELKKELAKLIRFQKVTETILVGAENSIKASVPNSSVNNLKATTPKISVQNPKICFENLFSQLLQEISSFIPPLVTIEKLEIQQSFLVNPILNSSNIKEATTLQYFQAAEVSTYSFRKKYAGSSKEPFYVKNGALEVALISKENGVEKKVLIPDPACPDHLQKFEYAQASLRIGSIANKQEYVISSERPDTQPKIVLYPVFQANNQLYFVDSALITKFSQKRKFDPSRAEGTLIVSAALGGEAANTPSTA
uniref:hypothetical protein n=1 Tax=Coelastrella saipanensis TaxID=152631 RepID=UPI0010C54483|nr:hypothetical protein [Coelastrella saipanensis]AVV61554.1 hypothetical protein [Coelastrella saipanensis]